MSPSQLQHDRFVKLWVGVQPLVRSYIYGTVRDAHTAEDLLQSVAATTFEAFDRYDPARPFTAWVMRIARNQVVDHFRRTGGGHMVFDTDTLEALAGAHDRLADTSADRRAALDHCLKGVHDRGRLALELRYRELMPVTRIAGELGTTAHAISVLLNKVRNKLAECIDRRLRVEEES